MRFSWSLALHWLSLCMAAEIAMSSPPRCIMYLTGQHPVVPAVEQLKYVTHVSLAFMRPGTFNDPDVSDWPLFATVADLRPKFPAGTKIMIAIGGWGDALGFSVAATSAETRKTFADNVARMVRATGADGIDVDWEYPGGNGEDYKQVPNYAKAWEIPAYPLLLSELRASLGPDKTISAAVPGLERDMLAFTSLTVPHIMRHLDFLNVMTYDLMNRRDTMTKHHTGIQLSLEAVDAYIAAGADPGKLNLGFAFYTKYFQTEHEACASTASPVGCPTLLLEDPETGADLGRGGGFSWHDSVPENVAQSFTRALGEGTYDDQQGGYYYWDEAENLWWSFDTPDAIKRKFPLVLEKRGLGGVFAWGLGEDAPLFEHLAALNEGLAEHLRPRVAKEEL
ncbi:glycoside hydrolase family 18 protein [Lasiosphaeria ovina]|uniref:chitinase n=1 Tax=Lasiosphaeria ovina TaxID=92902 RepID=A0AAE0MYW1_9PEZI|nr:glycoside hydrolase family 18 protein [Lasiosphaeria ovina]